MSWTNLRTNMSTMYVRERDGKKLKYQKSVQLAAFENTWGAPGSTQCLLKGTHCFRWLGERKPTDTERDYILNKLHSHDYDLSFSITNWEVWSVKSSSSAASLSLIKCYYEHSFLHPS